MSNGGGKTSCALCGRMFPHTEMEQFCGQWVCPRCLRNDTFVCSCCGNRVARSERVDCAGTQICQTCFDAHFTLCYICGRLLPQERVCWYFLEGLERPLCSHCMKAITEKGVERHGE